MGTQRCYMGTPKSEIESCDESEGKLPHDYSARPILKALAFLIPHHSPERLSQHPRTPTHKPLPCPTSGRQLLGINDLGCILMAGTELDTASDHRESPSGNVGQETDTGRERERTN